MFLLGTRAFQPRISLFALPLVLFGSVLFLWGWPVARILAFPIGFLVFTLMLTSKGVAGVPRAALVILLGTVASFHLPAEPVFIILGIDELMDMARTSVNVLGNCLASVVIARWEGQFKTESRGPVRTQTVSL